MAKREITGKAVIYTHDGAKIIDAEVRRQFNVYQDSNRYRFNFADDYVLVGGARTVETDNIYAKPAYHPETIDYAFKYASTKFFRLMLDLMRLAQWEPIHPSNYVMHGEWFTSNKFQIGKEPDIDFSVSLAEIDAQFYRKYEFTPAMIAFTEARYSYDDVFIQDERSSQKAR